MQGKAPRLKRRVGMLIKKVSMVIGTSQNCLTLRRSVCIRFFNETFGVNHKFVHDRNIKIHRDNSQPVADKQKSFLFDE